MNKASVLALLATVALLSVAHGFSRTAVGRVSSRQQQRPLAASFTGDDNLQDKDNNQSRPFFAKPAEQQQGPSTSGTPSNRMKPPQALSTNSRSDSRLNGKQQQGASAANKEPNYYLSNWRSEPKQQTQSQQQQNQQQRQLGSWSRAAVPTPPNQVAVAPPRRDPFARPQQEQQSRDQPRRVVAPSFARAPVPPPPPQPQVPPRQAQIPQPRRQRQRQQQVQQQVQQPPRQQQVQQQVQQQPRSYATSDTRYRTKPYGDTYSLFSFVAYLQASFVSCFTGGLAAAPFLFYHWYAYAPTSYTMAAQVEYDLGAALLSAFLFGGVYRYCVRDDVQNATLKDRVTWAFVLVRSLVRIEVPMECAAGGVHVAPGVDLPLACADPLPFANYGMLSDFAMNFSESAALFGVAAVVLNGLLDSNYIRRFPG